MSDLNSVCEVKMHNAVAVLTMTNRENKQNPQFARQMLEQLQAVQANSDARALIITSSDEKNWSQGIDIDWLMPAMKTQKFPEIKQFMYDMDEVFKTLLTFPMPVIAAINGHAFGNGAILACACDFRFMRADKGFFCFPEVDLSIPFLPGMMAFIKKAIPQFLLNEMILSGRRVTADELAQKHVLESAFSDNDSLQQGALEFAAQFDKKRPIFAEHKKRAYKDILDVINTENSPLIDALKLTM